MAGSQFLQLPPCLVSKDAVLMCLGDFFAFGTAVSAIAMGPAVFACSPLAKLFVIISIVVSIYSSIFTIGIHEIF